MKYLFALLIALAGAVMYGAEPQIKSGQVFSVPMVDGTTAAARVEIVSGKARMTLVTSNQFLDLLITAWEAGPTPSPVPVPPTPTPPGPTPGPTPPAPPSLIAAALIVITETPATSGGAWTQPAVVQYNANHGITAYNYATSSVGDPAYSDLAGLKWIGKAAGATAYPWAIVVDASGNILWKGVCPTAEELVKTLEGFQKKAGAE